MKQPCPKCGSKIRESAVICPSCGTVVAEFRTQRAARTGYVLFSVGLVLLFFVVAFWRVSQPSNVAEIACRSDWHSCTIYTIAVSWQGWDSAEQACRSAATDREIYDTPKWRLERFREYRFDRDAGRLVLMDDDAELQEGSRASQRMQITCIYDLQNTTVRSVDMRLVESPRHPSDRPG
jgi:hypothetical protein